MITENKRVSKYILDINKKMVNDFYNQISQKKSGFLSHLTHDLVNSSNLSNKEINFLIEFSELKNIIKVYNQEYELNSDISKDKFLFDFCNFYFNSIYSDESIHSNIFQSSKLSLENDFIVIDLNSINIIYTPILTTLSRLGFINYEKNYAYVKNLVFAKKLLERPLKKLKKSLNQFEKEQYEKSERGKLAEIFVLNFEKKKLEKTKYNPIRISLDDVGAGYDILSFEINGDKKFIEVKSISKSRFFWSENEVNNSKIFKDNYFIYCVRFVDGKPKEISHIICNPYKEIFINKKYRKKSVEDYIIYIP